MGKRGITRTVAVVVVAIIIVVAAIGVYYFTLPPPAPERVTIRIMSAFNIDPITVQMHNFFDEYKKIRPNVDFDYYIVAWPEIISKYSSLKAVEEQPDVIFLSSWGMQFLYSAGDAVPATEIVNEIGEKDFFYPGIIDAVKIEGDYYMIPTSVSAFNIQYRKDLFQEYGIEVPRTWDEMLDAAKKLTVDTDGDGVIDIHGYGACMSRSSDTGDSAITWFWSNGGTLTNQEGQVIIDSPENIETLEFLAELFQYAPPGVATWTTRDREEAYQIGKLAMLGQCSMMGLDRTYRVDKTIAINSGIMAAPLGPRGTEVKSRVAVNGISFVKSSHSTPIYNEIKDFFVWMFKPENYVRFVFSAPVWQHPVTPQIYESSEYQNLEMVQDMRDAMDQYLDGVCATIQDPIMDSGVPNLNVPKLITGLTFVDLLQEVVIKGTPAEEAAAKYKPLMREALGG